MSNFNSPSDFNASFTPKARARKMSPVLVGGIVLALIGGIGNLTNNAGHGPQTNTNPSLNQPAMTSPYNGAHDSENDSTGQNGYAPQGNSIPAPTDQMPTYPAPSSQPPSPGDAMDNGYAAREKAQDQSAQAFDNYIRDTDTVRDTENGQVYTNVPNDQANSAIQSGAATEVPTAELPTSGDSGTASTPDTSASTAE